MISPPNGWWFNYTKKSLHPPLPPGRSHVVALASGRSTWRNALTARSSAAISFHDLARQEIQRNGEMENVGFAKKAPKIHVSNEKNPGCLGYIGDYTTQLYRDYKKKHHKDPY